jgi:hypothetical protein
MSKGRNNWGLSCPTLIFNHSPYGCVQKLFVHRHFQTLWVIWLSWILCVYCLCHTTLLSMMLSSAGNNTNPATQWTLHEWHKREWCVTTCSPLSCRRNSNSFNKNPPLAEVWFTWTIYNYTADTVPLTHFTNHLFSLNLCNFSLSHPACKVSYCHLWPSAYAIFFHIIS